MLETVSNFIGFAAAAIIVWGIVLGIAELLQYEYYRIRGFQARLTLNEVRHVVASYLLLGLEFLIAADIIRTVSDPTLEELAILGGLVAIRTVISYFLGREIRQVRPSPHEKHLEAEDKSLPSLTKQ